MPRLCYEQIFLKICWTEMNHGILQFKGIWTTHCKDFETFCIIKHYLDQSFIQFVTLIDYVTIKSVSTPSYPIDFLHDYLFLNGCFRSSNGTSIAAITESIYIYILILDVFFLGFIRFWVCCKHWTQQTIQ